MLDVCRIEASLKRLTFERTCKVYRTNTGAEPLYLRVQTVLKLIFVFIIKIL